MKLFDVKDLVRTYGWTEIPSKNNLMVSFVDGSNRRLNIYVTWTFTIQGPDGICHTWREVDTLEKVEEILLANQGNSLK